MSAPNRLPRHGMVNSHALNQRIHAIRRARERFGLEIDMLTLEHIAQYVRSGQACFYGKSHGASAYDIEIGNCRYTETVTLCRVVYDHYTQGIVTFCPVSIPSDKKRRKSH